MYSSCSSFRNREISMTEPKASGPLNEKKADGICKVLASYAIEQQ